MQVTFKNFISAFVLGAFAVLGAGSIDDDGNIEGWFWCVLAVLVVVFIPVVVSESKKQKEREAIAYEERQARRERRRKEKEEFEASYKKYQDENGIPDKAIFVQDSMDSAIFVHENSKKVYLLGTIYNFVDILSCTFSDNSRIIKGAVTAVTKSKNGSTIGRAIVGDVIAGPAGAIIGGTTGKKTTEYKQEDDKVVHDYTVTININSISTPIVSINTGSNETLTNEIVGLMNVIISRR